MNAEFRPSPAQQSLIDRLRNAVGRRGVVGCCGQCRIFEVVNVAADAVGWTVTLCDPDCSDRVWGIGRFPWRDDELPYLVAKDYWHFPLLSERYDFSETMLAQYQLQKASGAFNDTPARDVELIAELNINNELGSPVTNSCDPDRLTCGTLVLCLNSRGAGKFASGYEL